MDELDKSLLAAIYNGLSLNKLEKVPEGNINWFKASANGDVYEFVIDPKPIKKAFIDAGWHPPISFYQIIAISKRIVAGDEPDLALIVPDGYMTGQEWYDRFEKEYTGSAWGAEVLRVLTMAKKAAGIE